MVGFKAVQVLGFIYIYAWLYHTQSVSREAEVWSRFIFLSMPLLFPVSFIQYVLWERCSRKRTVVCRWHWPLPGVLGSPDRLPGQEYRPTGIEWQREAKYKMQKRQDKNLWYQGNYTGRIFFFKILFFFSFRDVIDANFIFLFWPKSALGQCVIFRNMPDVWISVLGGGCFINSLCGWGTSQ